MRKLLLSILALALLLPVPGAFADEDDLVVQVFNKTNELRIVSVTIESASGGGGGYKKLEGGTEAYFDHSRKDDYQMWMFSITDENLNEIAQIDLSYSNGLFFPGVISGSGSVSFSMDGQHPFLDINK